MNVYFSYLYTIIINLLHLFIIFFINLNRIVYMLLFMLIVLLYVYYFMIACMFCTCMFCTCT